MSIPSPRGIETREPPSNGGAAVPVIPAAPPPPAAEGRPRPPAAPPAEAVPAPRRRRRGVWVAVALALALVAALVAGRSLTTWLSAPAPAGLLFASGRIEGRITTLTPKAAARVTALHADEGQAVAAGQLLATLDDQAQRERVRSAEEQISMLAERRRAADAQIAMTERQVALQTERAEAALREAEAQLERARASFAQAQRDAERAALLHAREFISAQAAERERLAARVEEHGVAAAEQVLIGSQKQLALARLGAEDLEVKRAEREALVRQWHQARAQLAEQQSHVDDFSIRSPVAGRILTRTVELGERVEAGTPLFTLVDLDQLYVKIYVPEPSIGRVALGQEARIHVDAYPGRAFAARVSRVAQEAEFTPKNVETREERVKLVFAVELALSENPGGVLKPGMPADAVVRWQPGAAWVAPGEASRGGLWRRQEPGPAAR